MTEHNKPDLLTLDQVEKFDRTGVDRFGIRIATVVLHFACKALAEGHSVYRQQNRP